MRKRDPEGYYAALNVSPDASSQEIRLAYNFLKSAYLEKRNALDIAKIRTAFETLRNPKTRKVYDHDAAAGGAVGRRLKFDSVPLLIGVSLVLMIVVAIILFPLIRERFVTFDPGDYLYQADGGPVLGTVLSFDKNHRFPNGMVAPAYEVRPDSGDPVKWYPARDLRRHFEVRKP